MTFHIKKYTIITVLLCFIAISCKVQGQKWEYSEYKRYTNVKRAIKDKEDVIVLDLSGKKLNKIPEEVFQLKNLRVLILVDNEIKNIPVDIQNLQNLEQLQMMKNELTQIPKEVAKLKNLKRINVAYNKIYEKDVEFLKKALPECTIISDIIL